MPTERPTVHYVVSTHWDREWYEPFQHYRWRLVRLLDRVMDGIAAGEMDGPFTCDGQAIILDDYLEIRPERRTAIERLVCDGKLVVGPWYVLPDEFLVSGETMIRNIELGRQIARDFGGTPSNAGFVCDLFGHVSQLPQILAGFGVNGTLVWRGLELDREMCGFNWRGADGTTLPSYRFGCDGYCDFAVKGRGLWTRTPPTLEQLSGFATAEMQRSNIGAALIFDGADHIEWDPAVSKLIREHNALPDRSCDIVHSTLDAFLSELAQRSSRFRQTIDGELRIPASRMHDEDHSWLIPGVLSSRVWIKQQNDECTALLTHWAEPMALLAGELLESAYPGGFLQTAWKYLLKNHPHDSICGCSIDAVHQDVEYRFRQTKQIAERLRRESCRDIVGAISPRVEDKALRFAVFNPSVESREEVVVATLAIPADWPKFNEFFGFEPKPGFVIEDADGNEVPYQRLDQSMNRNKFRTFAWQFPQGYKTDDVTIAFEASLPALGYTSFTVRPVEGKPTRYPAVPSLATSDRSIENEHLSVRVATDGTITLTDKRSQQTYERLLSYESVADIGDGWYHGPAVNDERISSVGSPVRVSIVHDTPFLATLRLRTALELPAEFDFATMRRSQRTTSLVIETDLTLTRGAAHIEATTRILNNVCDHRLRVLLPTGADTQTYRADSAFDVVERPIALNDRNHTYRELEVETKPQHSFTVVNDAKRGLAVA
ncbi:MAG TPA: glycoside hydrolase family 38 C-terminal domain-containing protein, partial [Tepidisphaeraceae bacterium]|nr:glycoside hydrolase family 38 C-terminal domain-containing protein [Tepidisphaeraceae bacterium]